METNQDVSETNPQDLTPPELVQLGMKCISIPVANLRPGDLMIVDNNGTTKYVKNIYDANRSDDSFIKSLLGGCIAIEYTDAYDKCNIDYNTFQTYDTQVDNSCWPPRILSTDDSVNIVVNH